MLVVTVTLPAHSHDSDLLLKNYHQLIPTFGGALVAPQQHTTRSIQSLRCLDTVRQDILGRCRDTDRQEVLKVKSYTKRGGSLGRAAALHYTNQC